MSRIVLHMMMSLDGFVASVDCSGSWMVAPDHDRDAASLEVATTAVAAIAGHDVYHDMAGYWPTAEGDTPTQRAYVERVNQMPKLIITHQPAQLDWNNATASPSPTATSRGPSPNLRRLGTETSWCGAAPPWSSSSARPTCSMSISSSWSPSPSAPASHCSPTLAAGGVST